MLPHTRWWEPKRLRRQLWLPANGPRTSAVLRGESRGTPAASPLAPAALACCPITGAHGVGSLGYGAEANQGARRREESREEARCVRAEA